jgi:WD40 repeat protein
MLIDIKFSPDGKRLVARDWPGSGVLALWDVGSSKRLTTIEASNHCVSPDWRTIYTSRQKQKCERVEQDGKRTSRWTFDGGVRAWNLDDGKLVRTYKHQPPRGISGMRLSPDGSKLLTIEALSGTYERNFKGAFSFSLWDIPSGKSRPMDGLHGTATFSPDSQSLVFIVDDDDGYAQARKSIDVATSRENWSRPLAGANYWANVGTFSRDGRLLFGSIRRFERAKKWDNWRVWLTWWDAATGREVASFEGDKNDEFTDFSLSPDGQTLAVLNWRRGVTRKLFLYSVAEKCLLRTTILGEKPKDYVLLASGSVFSPDGKWLVVVTRVVPENARGGGDLDPRDLPQPHILLIETATGAIRETMISPQCFSNHACFSPDGRTLATGGHGRVLLWDMTKMPD